jgi:hypothetical protein
MRDNGEEMIAGRVKFRDLRAEPLHVRCFWAFVAIGHFKGHPFSLVEGFVAFANNTRMVDKDVFPRLLGNKPIAPLIIEPFDFPTGHNFFLP